MLATKPDLILWILSPTDIGETSNLVREEHRALPATGAGKGGSIHGLANSACAFLASEARNQSTGSLLRIVLYQIRTLYVRNYLMRGRDSDFLRMSPNPQWAVSLKQFESYADEIEGKAKLAGVPVVSVLLPNRAQAAMLGMGNWPEESDPYKLDNDLRTIIRKHGGIYVDILPYFRAIPDAETYYYPIDGHPDAPGHVLITRMLVDAFSQSPIAEFHPAAERASAVKGN